MKNFLILSMLLLMNTKVIAQESAAQIEAKIRELFSQTDAWNWDAVAACFAPQVLLDYSSMTGAEATTLSPAEIIAAWSSVLPGFESTQHQIGQFQINVNGERAIASLRGLATHFLPLAADPIWAVVGSYDFELQLLDGVWKVSLMRFNFQQQVGNTDLPALAQQAVVNDNLPTKSIVVPEADRSLLNEFFDALEALDIERFQKVWAEQAEQHMPLAPAHFPKELIGQAAIYNQYKDLPQHYESMQFPREILPTSIPHQYLVRYYGIIPMANGQTYHNNYVGLFQINDGRIERFIEYFDPYILAAAFGTDLQDNFNVQTPEVEVREVSFFSEGLVLKGNLYYPINEEEGKEYPAVVVAGTWTSVKEQMANRYAEGLAKEGFIALSFDFRGYGKSEGQPRNFENPEWKIADIEAAVSYLRDLAEVSADEVYGLGICAGAGYMATAASKGIPMAKISLVAPWLHNGKLVELIYGGAAGVRDRLDKAKTAKAHYAVTGEVLYVPAISETDTEAAMYGPWEFYLNPDRGAIPEWDGQFAVMAWEKWLTFDPIAIAPQVKVPTLMVHSEAAAIPDGVKRFAESLGGVKKMIWTEGEQFDFYDGDRVGEALQYTAEWFKE